MTDERVGGVGLGSRRASRERALELLYEAETKGDTVTAVLANLPLTTDAYAEAVVRGVEARQDELDALIDDASHHWRLTRMPAVDRALLRLGTWELAHRPDVPTGVILAEAVELAGEYSTEGSAKFVNGVLSRLATDLRPGDPGEAAAGAGDAVGSGAHDDPAPAP